MRTKRSGAVAVEMAICAPLLCFFLLAAIDIWRLYVNNASLIAVAEGGAQYGSINPWHSTHTSGIQKAALLNNACEDTPTVESSIHSATHGKYTNTYITVTATVPFQFFTPVPGMPNQLTAKRSYIVRPNPNP